MSNSLCILSTEHNICLHKEKFYFRKTLATFEHCLIAGVPLSLSLINKNKSSANLENLKTLKNINDNNTTVLLGGKHIIGTKIIDDAVL